jgi:FtsZ-binding cell division protein ZapB
MITLEQIKLLEQKIEAAVAKITALTTENASLKGMCDEYDAECSRLQAQVDSAARAQEDNARLTTEVTALRSSRDKYQSEQAQIEQAVLHVIDRLEAMETTILETVVTRAEAASPPAAPPAVPPPAAATGVVPAPQPSAPPPPLEIATFAPAEDDSVEEAGDGDSLDLF